MFRDDNFNAGFWITASALPLCPNGKPTKPRNLYCFGALQGAFDNSECVLENPK
jgi:hypothetical protein